MSYSGKLILMMGVSGAGKKTVMDAMLASDLGLRQVNSYTTRPLRPGETNGEDYNHITEEEFDKAKADGEFLECEFVHELFWYGTKRKDIVEKLEAGENITKEMNINGLIAMSESHPDVRESTRSIFLNINDETMVERITKRGQLSEQEMHNRLHSAINERTLAKQYCTDMIDASGTIEEVSAHTYKVIAAYVNKEII